MTAPDGVRGSPSSHHADASSCGTVTAPAAAPFPPPAIAPTIVPTIAPAPTISPACESRASRASVRTAPESTRYRRPCTTIALDRDQIAVAFRAHAQLRRRARGMMGTARRRSLSQTGRQPPCRCDLRRAKLLDVLPRTHAHAVPASHDRRTRGRVVTSIAETVPAIVAIARLRERCQVERTNDQHRDESARTLRDERFGRMQPPPSHCASQGACMPRRLSYAAARGDSHRVSDETRSPQMWQRW